MKTISKKALSIILCMVMLMSTFAIGITASAETVDSGIIGTYFEWVLFDDGLLYISSSEKRAMTDFRNYNDAPWYYLRDKINEIKLTSNVTSIGNYAFYNCSNLEKIQFEDDSQLTSIGYDAFNGCSSLTSITIPKGIKKISGSTFYGCSNLTTVVIPDGVISINGYAFYNCKSLKNINIPDSVTSIGQDAFQECSSLTSITFGENSKLTSIGDDAFAYCSSLTSITIPEGVTSIGDYAFEDCTSLTSITIPEGVTSIGDYAFAYCSSLTSITIPDGVTSIGDSAFRYCYSLTSITIPDNVTSIGEEAFNLVNNISYSKNMKATGNPWGAKCVNGFVDGYIVYSDASRSKLYGCSSAYKGNVTLPNSVTIIGSNAFYNCNKLSNISFEENSKLTSIGSRAFYGCSSLTSITIPDGVTSIDEYAFYGCSSLTSIIIPDGVTSIGEHAFLRCTSLKSMVIPNSVTSIGKGALDGCSSINSITLPFVGDKIHKATDTYQYPFGYIFGATQYTDETKQYYIGSSLDSIEFSYYCIPSSLKSVTITGNTIPYGAFYNCSNLTNITLGKNVKDIGNNAFYNCASLTSIIIPDGVTIIGTSAFSGCSSLATVTLGKGLTDFENIKSSGVLSSSKLKTINLTAGNTSFATVDGVLFSKDLSTIYLYPREKTGTEYTVPAGVKRVYKNCFSGSKLTKINMPNGLQNIGDSAFSSCSSLRSVTIPKAVTYIGNSAFAGDSIDDIYYGGSSSDKDKITVGSSNSPLQSAIWHYNTVIVDKPAVPDKPATHTHSYKSSVTTKATCTKAGVMTYVCSCGNSYTKAIPATGHKDSNADKVCDVCGAKITTLNAKINVASAKSVDYKAQVTIKATANGVPAGYSLAMYVNGKQVAKGSNTEVTYTVGQATSDINYTVKVIDAKGNVQKDSANKDLAKDGGKITVNSSFFAKIIAFFKSLFGSLSKVEVKP